MSLDREIQMAAERSKTMAARARAAARMLFKAKTVRAYRQLFLRDGNLTPEATLVLADLANAAGLGKVRPGGTAEEMNFREGRRAIVLHLFARLDAQTLEKLAQRIREASADEHDDD